MVGYSGHQFQSVLGEFWRRKIGNSIIHRVGWKTIKRTSCECIIVEYGQKSSEKGPEWPK